jgi:hypothetical protein
MWECGKRAALLSLARDERERNVATCFSIANRSVRVHVLLAATSLLSGKLCALRCYALWARDERWA